MNGEYELLDETGIPHYLHMKSRTMPTTLKAGLNNLTLRFDSDEIIIKGKSDFEFSGETRFKKDGCTASIVIKKNYYGEDKHSCKITIIGDKINIIQDMIDELDQRLFGTKILDWDAFVEPKSFIDKLKWLFS